MALTLDDVRRVAYLARIEISDAEADATLVKLTSIFGMIEALQKVDTEGVEPMAHAQDIAMRLREDRAVAVDPAEQKSFQEIAPQIEDGLYLVPRVVE